MQILTTDVQGRAATIASTPTVTTLPLDYARTWRLQIENTHGSQNITALRLRRRTHAAGPWSEWVSVTAGLPLAAGDVLSVVPDADDCAKDLDVELTADANDTTVAFWLAGTR